MSLAGCQMIPTQTSATDGSSVACNSFQPISYSRTDTPETRRQIVAHNAAYAALCEE